MCLSYLNWLFVSAKQFIIQLQGVQHFHKPKDSGLCYQTPFLCWLGLAHSQGSSIRPGNEATVGLQYTVSVWYIATLKVLSIPVQSRSILTTEWMMISDTYIMAMSSVLKTGIQKYAYKIFDWICAVALLPSVAECSLWHYTLYSWVCGRTIWL